ncbi:CHAP domain-containing protein [Roseateles sp. YR242]|uniref:CHAP domain-containing protein n=1 Tax=Roseateles sp. YR242 TaxID=1855305 RepID=UPI0008B2871C|nr:CHAP domain-containing protein [Roseateles sp. YR242]SEK30967.1 CHAP domain-containing protein [Roseateles sp. YR242]
MISVDQLLTRARAATGHGTLYWLSEGGRDPRARLPSTRLAVGRLWPTLPREQREELAPLAAEMGIDVKDSSLVMDACDCSGFVCWALGFSRLAASPAPYTDAAGWIFTDSIWADATGPGERFRGLDRAVPGALVVYPAKDSGERHGHVAIVVEADASGRATLIAHCAADNVRQAPHDAIKLTTPEAFEAQPRSVYAWCREVS